MVEPPNLKKYESNRIIISRDENKKIFELQPPVIILHIDFEGLILESVFAGLILMKLHLLRSFKSLAPESGKRSVPFGMMVIS